MRIAELEKEKKSLEKKCSSLQQRLDKENELLREEKEVTEILLTKRIVAIVGCGESPLSPHVAEQGTHCEPEQVEDTCKDSGGQAADCDHKE